MSEGGCGGVLIIVLILELRPMLIPTFVLILNAMSLMQIRSVVLATSTNTNTSTNADTNAYVNASNM